MSKTVLITGASQGLGYEFAKIFAKNSYNLILVARRKDVLVKIKEELEKAHDISVEIIPSDLSVHSASESVYATVQNKHLQVDVLVNNAGFATHGKFIDVSLSEEIGEIQVNITALTMLTKLFAKDMVKRGEGKILNVASTAAFQPGPLMAVYYATKAYVLSFTEALSQELQGTGVTVSALCPGATRTGFAKRADVEGTIFFQTPDDASWVVQVGYDGLMKGKRVIIPGFKNTVGSWLGAFIPRSLLLKWIMKMQPVR